MNFIISSDLWGLNPDTYGNYLFKPVHLVSILCYILLTVAVLLLMKYLVKKSPTICRKIVIGLAIASLVFEVVWRVVFLTCAPAEINTAYPWYPCYPCNLNAFFVPIAALTNNKTMKRLFYAFSIVCAILMMTYPAEVFVQPYIILPALKSLIQHWNILIIPAIELVIGTYKIEFRKLWLCISGMLIHVFNSTFITWILTLTINFPDADYIFFKFFGDTAPGYIIVTAVAIIVMSTIYALVDRKGCKTTIAKIKEHIKAEKELDNLN